MNRYSLVSSVVPLVLLAVLAGCAGKSSKPPVTAKPSSGTLVVAPPVRPEYDGPPPQTVDVMKIPEPVPRVEPRARYGNHSPYQVFGRTYHVLPTAQGYKERGIASWYGTKFHGQPTSTMEPYDMFQFTAAHRSLPLPSYARVTNLENGASLIVRINDRGPFAHNRVIDLSYAAARRLGIYERGTGLVEVVAINPDTSVAAAPPEPLDEGVQIFLQAGAFSEPGNADALRQRLQEARVEPVQVVAGEPSRGLLHRVRVGPLTSAEAADAAAERMRALGLESPRLVIE